MWYGRLLGEEDYENQMYGHDSILRTYAKVKLPYVIPGRLPHGWHPDCGIQGDIGKHGEREKQGRYFVWNRRNLERSAQRGYKNVTAIGSPFLYMPDLVSSSDSNVKGPRSLLLFPKHSSESDTFSDPVRTHKAYLEEIKELLGSFGPVNVCLYWIEYENRDIVQLFNDNGIDVVTLGHRDNNPRYLFNFREIVDKYAYISSNVYATASYYSLFMRKKVFIFGKPDIAGLRQIVVLYNHQEFVSLYPELLWENFDDKSHYQIAEEELGLEFKRTPKELRELFGWTPQNFIKNIFLRSLRTPAFLRYKVSKWLKK